MDKEKHQIKKQTNNQKTTVTTNLP